MRIPAVLAILALSVLSALNTAYAAPPVCNGGSEGTIIYNKDRKLVQFCNGTEWIGMVAKIGGTGDTLSDLTCQTDEVPVWSGSAWTCGEGGGGGDSLWSDSGSGYLTYTGTDAGIKIQSITGMSPPKNTLADLGCASNQILKWDGDSWECANDNGGTLPSLTSANIWVGNASNTAAAVTLSGDATLSNAGVLTIANNAVTSAKIADGSVTNADLAGSIALSKLSVTGTANSSVFLRGDGTWAAPPSGADNLGNHTATTNLLMGTNQISFNNVAGDKAYWSNSNTYGTGIESTTLTNWSAGNHRWRVGGTSASTGTEKMLLNSTGLTVSGTVAGAAFSGSGASLTALNASNLASGTVPAARLPAYTGDVTKAAGGTALTIAANAVTSAKIADGTIANADIANATIVATTKLSATGTKNSSTFLRGDNTWATIATGAMTKGALCGLAYKTGGTSPASATCANNNGYSNIVACDGTNLTGGSCPSGSTLRLLQMANPGGSCGLGSCYHCIRTCSKN